MGGARPHDGLSRLRQNSKTCTQCRSIAGTAWRVRELRGECRNCVASTQSAEMLIEKNALSSIGVTTPSEEAVEEYRGRSAPDWATSRPSARQRRCDLDHSGRGQYRRTVGGYICARAGGKACFQKICAGGGISGCLTSAPPGIAMESGHEVRPIFLRKHL